MCGFCTIELRNFGREILNTKVMKNITAGSLDKIPNIQNFYYFCKL